MKTYLINNISKFTRRLVLCSLMLCAFVGQALAQDGQYVIKKGSNYLAHHYNETSGRWELTNATAFSPECLWFSGPRFNTTGTNHNYYFYDGENYRFLAAPLQSEGQLSLSASLPSTTLLRNTDQVYYFYNWDSDEYGGGVARGHQYTGVTNVNECQYSWDEDDGQCWEAYWVEFDGGTWQLSNASFYDITENSGRFRLVTVTEHEMDIINSEGGLTALSVPAEMEWGGAPASLSASVSNYSYTYRPSYTAYVFEGTTHYYYGGADHNETLPTQQTSNGNTVSSYLWSISGDGAEFLSLNDATSATPTLTYSTENTTGHKTATVTLTVTYIDQSTHQSTQTLTATVVVKTQCQNPVQSSAPVVTYEGATVSWVHTANSYKVYWKKASDADYTNFAEVGNVNSYTITGLDYETTYNYKVAAICDGAESQNPAPAVYSFTTKETPGLLVYGCVYGGGRMADVGGNTEVAIINCDSIYGVYGGNDIAGTVQGSDGSSITLGVNSGDDYASYGTTNAEIRISEVYGGGNGYYAYDGTSFVPATSDYTSQVVQPNGSVAAITRTHEVGEVVWINEEAEAKTLTFPSIVKTAITVTNDYVKVDSIFGGAKNAFLTFNDYTQNGSTITVEDGTVYAIFGGNNYGGTQGYGKHHIEINGTKTNLTANVQNTATTGYGRDFGIRYVFGGGNKVYGSTTEVFVNGGQCDTIFGGGNAADVYAANVTVNCPIASGTNNAFGSVYSQAISSYSDGNVTVSNGYAWDGTGIYNVRTLFGGNNMAHMEGLPNITLTSGSIGTAYGGGNAGDMLAQKTDNGNGQPLVINEKNVKYSTHIQLNSPTVLVDYLYGGCQMSNVDYSTWVEVKNGHVGTVYGGCNVSGDVGSTRVYPDFAYSGSLPEADKIKYQTVQGATYVVATGGTVYKNVFAGSNGFYHCNNGINYKEGINYADSEGLYIGMPIPTHNETNVVISQDAAAETAATVKGNVYAGGNMAYVGFHDAVASTYPSFPYFVGMASVRMDAGTVMGDVFGGGNMASVYGSNEVRVSGGTIGNALYGGNDRTGQVAQITNRILPEDYRVASDGLTPLDEVHSYVSLTGTPTINTVFGGGNGDYVYEGEGADMQYCFPEDQPIQSNTFVDINIDHNGHIGTVYGGGDGVTVTGFVKVFLNVNNPSYQDHDHVGTIFGGNNKGDLELVPDIILFHGKVGTVYGGCNQGAMNATTGQGMANVSWDVDGDGEPDGSDDHVGSLVRVPRTYQATSTTQPVPATAMVSQAIYGGCRMNGVAENTLVLIERGDLDNVSIFGGSDISGNVYGKSRVVVTGGTIGDAYGGGNGLYDYTLPEYSGLAAPFCFTSEVCMLNGAATRNLYAGGLAGESGETYLRVKGGTVGGKVFGGGYRAGVVIRQTGIDETDPEQPVTTYTSGSSTIMMDGGTVLTGIYGGCNDLGDIEGDVRINLNGGTVGSLAMLQDHNVPQIFGGGYGADTKVRGNVEVNMWPSNGDAPAATVYGDIYGGSALGHVNTNSMTTLENYVEPTNTTTVNIWGGTVVSEGSYGGNIYGGGLGDADHAALVHGVVHVNIGYHEGENGEESSLRGKATLIGCNVFGCNNVNGSPQSNVYVDVYRTAHIEGTNTIPDDDYAIGQVFGGGNHAHYAPLDVINPDSISDPNHQNNLAHLNRTHVYVHGCQNTINYVYGGGNAANALGVETIIDGGRFNEVYGGGNGRDIPANIGDGSLGIIIHGGHVNYFFEGCNKQGIIGGKQYEPAGTPEFDCGELIVDSYFFGDNEAEHIGDMENTIDCADAANFNYKYVYAGSRWATIYGNVTLTVRGGHIENLFGGSKGYNETGGDPIPADIRKYPSVEQIDAVNAVYPGFYSQELRTYMVNHSELVGKGGNIILRVEGGTIGNVIGGCDEKGNVEGKITVIVESNSECGLFVGNVYGASNETDYEPTGTTLNTPEVRVIKATVGGRATFASGEKTYEGNVFGGGNIGNVTSSPKVVIGSTDSSKPVTIKGNVFGGGKLGRVNGNTEVIIVPTE